MNMKYYNASNHFSAPIPREPKPYSPYARKPEIVIPQKPFANSHRQEKQAPLHTPELPIAPIPHKTPPPKQEISFNNMKPDDLLLLGIIALLIWNSCDDMLLLFILGYLFLIGLK